MLIENTDATPGGLDSRYIDGLRALEPALVREIVVEFLGSTPANLAELRVASYAADACSVRQLAHKLRGVSGMLGAVGMSAELERLENMGRAGSLGESPLALERLEQQFAAVRPALEAELAA